MARPPRKASSRALVVTPAVIVSDGPYRTPPQVGRGKDLKVDERSFVKELGKLAP